VSSSALDANRRCWNVAIHFNDDGSSWAKRLDAHSIGPHGRRHLPMGSLPAGHTAQLVAQPACLAGCGVVPAPHRSAYPRAIGKNFRPATEPDTIQNRWNRAARRKKDAHSPTALSIHRAQDSSSNAQSQSADVGAAGHSSRAASPSITVSHSTQGSCPHQAPNAIPSLTGARFGRTTVRP